jgi:ParB family chromosome partitioning protein
MSYSAPRDFTERHPDAEAVKASSQRRGLALVTGAAGFLGQHLLAGLLNAGVRVRAVDREPLDGMGGPVEAVRADLERDSLLPLLDEVSVVFHLATVPCDVRPEYADRAPEQLADMLAENLHRRELSGVEEAGGYAQLSMFEGWTPERIARRLGRPAERVRAGLAAAEVGERLRPKVVDGSVTLEQAAAIEEFAGDEKAYARLLRAADYPAALHHAIAEERHKRGVDEQKAATRTALRDAGVRIISRPKEYPYGSVEARVDDLTGGDGEYLTPDGHAGCPGHAAFVDANTGEAVFVCQHPKEWGHGTSPSYRHLTAAEVRAAAEAADARREYETALAIATEARRSFLTEYLTRKGRPPAGTLRTAVMILARYGTTAGTRAAAALLLHPAGAEADPRDTRPAEAALVEAVDRSAENRLPYLVLAYAAAAGEQNLAASGRWSYDHRFAVHWLNVLTELGYPITDAEAQLRDSAQQQLLEAADEEADDDLEADGSVDDVNVDSATVTGAGPGEPEVEDSEADDSQV